MATPVKRYWEPKSSGSSGHWGPSMDWTPMAMPTDHDHPDKSDIAQRDQVERRNGNDGLEQCAVAVHRHTAEPVGQRAERHHQDGSEACGNEQAYRTDRIVSGKDAGRHAHERHQEGGVDGRIAVLAHPQADAKEHILLGVLPERADGVLDHILVLLQLLEAGVSLSLSRMKMATAIRMKLARKGTRHSQPCKDVLVSHGNQSKGSRAEEGAQLDAHERQGCEETTTAARSYFGDQRGGAGLLRAGAEALEDP